MNSLVSDLRAKFRQGNISIQYIYINVGLFLVASFIQVLMLLFNRDAASLLNYVNLPASLGRFVVQPWSLFTYMFMHAGMMHLLFNMLWLYWIGNLFLQFYSAKHFRGVYWLGGICGGVLYILSFNVFPMFQLAVNYSFLVGASASVLAVALAVAYKVPDYPIRLLLIGTVRLKYFVLFMVVMDMMMIAGTNGGGHIAHLGGAIAGAYFATSLAKGRDLTAWINRCLDWFADFYSRVFLQKQQKPKMKVHFGERSADYSYNARKKTQSEEIDRILDKLRKSGYGSLTDEEKKRLFDASQR